MMIRIIMIKSIDIPPPPLKLRYAVVFPAAPEVATYAPEPVINVALLFEIFIGNKIV